MSIISHSQQLLFSNTVGVRSLDRKSAAKIKRVAPAKAAELRAFKTPIKFKKKGNYFLYILDFCLDFNFKYSRFLIKVFM